MTEETDWEVGVTVGIRVNYMGAASPTQYQVGNSEGSVEEGSRGNDVCPEIDLSLIHIFPIYFCVPHSPWRRGSNENANGIPDIYPETSEGRTADGNDRDVAKIEPGCQLPGMGLRGSSPARQPFATSVWSPITRGLSTEMCIRDRTTAPSR